MKGKKKKKADQPVEPETQKISRFPSFSKRFREDLEWWYKSDRQKIDKILDLVEAVMQDPFTGIGKPEPITYLDADTWSRRIDLEHRLIYRVREERIDFLAARYHYNEE